MLVIVLLAFAHASIGPSASVSFEVSVCDRIFANVGLSDCVSSCISAHAC